MEVSITKLWRFNSTAKAKKVVIRGYDFNLGARKLDIFQIPICNAWQSHDFFSFFLSFLSFFLGMRPLRYIAYTLIYFSYSNFQFRNCHFKKSQFSKIILLFFFKYILSKTSRWRFCEFQFMLFHENVNKSLLRSETVFGRLKDVINKHIFFC